MTQKPANEDHFKQCQDIIRHFDRRMLLEGLYTTHICTPGSDTDDMRRAILMRLDFLSGTDWKKRE